MRDWKALVRTHLGPLPLDAARASDIVDELAQHVAEHHAELVASGLSDEAAVTAALAPLRDRRSVASEIARADRPRPTTPAPPSQSETLVAALVRDVEYALRVLARSRAFAAAAVATLAIGIGATTAIFSVLNAVLLRPLPYADPDRLVEVGSRQSDGSVGNVGYATFDDWRARSRAFEEIAAIRSWTATLAIDGRPERIAGLRVSANFFRMLGVQPALGSHFSPDNDAPDRWRTVLISDRLWRRAFGRDPLVVGRTIAMSDQTFTIAGVMPASFEPLISEHFYQRADMWAPLGYSTSDRFACRTCQHLKAIARLRSGMSADTARRDVDAVHQQIRREHPADYPPESLTVVPLETELTGNVRPALVVLMGAVAFLLLIGCANVANLLLARVAQRQRDMALRAALGASRGRLVRQLLVESAIVALAGGGLGIVAAWWAVPVLTWDPLESTCRHASLSIL